jgi:hypothetical protein
VWVPGDRRKAAQKRHVLVLRADVNVDGDEVLLPERSDLGILRRKPVQDLAPATPLSTDHHKDPFAARFGLLQSTGQILRWITRRIV